MQYILDQDIPAIQQVEQVELIRTAAGHGATPGPGCGAGPGAGGATHESGAGGSTPGPGRETGI